MSKNTKLIVPVAIARLGPAKALARFKRIQKAAVRKVRSEPITWMDRDLRYVKDRASQLRGHGNAVDRAARIREGKSRP